jgi:tRNA (guanine-N7-)-methyltransferase
MARQKLARFNQIAAASNVIERGKELYTSIKGQWHSKYFKNRNPIHVELACGLGEYTVSLGHKNPEINYIGIDIKGDRIARGSAASEKLGLSNVAFLRTGIAYLDEFFEENELDEIWIIHPDPQPFDKWEKKRLTYACFLMKYYKYLKPGGILRLKTDDEALFDYSLQSIANHGFKIIAQTKDLYANEILLAEHHGIETFYEKKFTKLGRNIHYLVAMSNKKGT